jgi:hypothetical protein
VTDPTPTRRPHGDVLAGAALLAVTAFGFWLTTGFREVPAMLSQNVPPTFFPRLVLGLIAVLSIAMIARGARRAMPRPVAIRANVLTTAVVVVLTPLAVALLGTWLTIAVVCIAIPWLWGDHRFKLVGLLALAMPVFVYALFALALELRFPVGRLFEML